jgi:hypothetical protein
MKQLLMMALVILAGCNQSPSGSAGKTNGVTPQKTSKENPRKAETLTDGPSEKVKATAIWYEYEKNPIAADAKYKGKAIEIEDFVDKIGIEEGKYFVGLMIAEGYPPGLVCFVDPAKSKSFENLKPRSPVSIIGTVRGVERDSSAWQGFRIVLTQCRAK